MIHKNIKTFHDAGLVDFPTLTPVKFWNPKIMCLFLYLGSIFPTYRPSDTVFKITFWLGYFNSCINPIIYPCSSQEFKKAFLSVLGARCLRKRSTPSHALYQSHSPRHGQSQILGLASRDNPSHLSPSSSIVLSRSPSSRDGREWPAPSRTPSAGTTGVSAGVSVGAKVAGMCGKNLLRTCCCVRMDSPQPEPPEHNSLPVIKIHQLSLCEDGDAVWMSTLGKSLHSRWLWCHCVTWQSLRLMKKRELWNDQRREQERCCDTADAHGSALHENSVFIYSVSCLSKPVEWQSVNGKANKIVQLRQRDAHSL